MKSILIVMNRVINFCVQGWISFESRGLGKAPGIAQQSDLEIIQTWAYKIGEGNGTPLQYSCLENLMDGGAW